MSSPFVGRAAELEALHDVRRELARNRGGIVLVGGPAGIGKSRLLAEFRLSLAGGRAPLVVRTECLDGGATLGPIRAILYELARIGPEAFAELAADETDRLAFYRSLERVVFEKSASRAIVVCVEDLHWADATTLDFLASLATHLGGKRVAIFATYRDDELEANFDLATAFARIARAPGVRTIPLRPLSDAQTTSLIESLAGDDRETVNIGSIVTRVDGNPFFAEELLKSALDGAATAGLPMSIRATVLARFARLSEADRDLLAHAAILGQRFDPALLATLAGVEAGAVAGALRRARDGAIVAEEADAEIRFRFRHALTHEAIAARTLEIGARPLHARVARILEALPDAGRRGDEIAYHWWKARDFARALVTNETAGERALELHAYDEAAQLFERALSVATAARDRMRLFARAALAASSHGDNLRALRFYERLLSLQIESRDFEAAGDTVRRIAGRLTYAGRDVEGVARIREFLSTHRANVSEVEALVLEGWPILMMLGGGGVRTWRERLLATAVPPAGGRHAWNVAFLEISAHAYAGDMPALHRAYERIRALGAHASPNEGALATVSIATTSAFCGEGGAARSALDEANRYLDAVGLVAMRKYVATAEAHHAYLRGETAVARRAAHVALGDAYDYNQRMNVAIVGSSIGLDANDRVLTELATDERIVRAVRENCTTQSTALAATGVARHLLATGRVDEARAILERAVAALETLYATQLLLPLAARFVDASATRAHLDALFARIEPDDVSAAASRAMVRATFAARDGDPAARELAHEAAARYANLGWPILEASARRLAGDVAPAGRDDPSRSRSIDVLTKRERQIAELVAEGASNREIADRLGIGVKTVESALTRIFTRLGFRSRAQLAAYSTKAP